MDKRWRPADRNRSRPFKKGQGGRFGRYSNLGANLLPTAAEDLAEYLLKALADNPDRIEITRDQISSRYTRIAARCDDDIVGRLIGKGGRTITAVRNLVKSIAQYNGRRVEIDISSFEEAEA